MRVAFIVDIVSPGRLPWRTSTSAINGMIEQITAVEALDFEVLLPGHSNMGTKADASDAKQYLIDLRAAVQAELDAGKSAEEIKANLKLPQYASWLQYEEWLPLNIEGVLTALQ